MSKQALYDFDGTITSKDTTILLLIELLKLRPWLFFGLLWSLLKMIVANDGVSKQRHKNKAIGHLIKDLSDIQLSESLQNFSNKVNGLYRPSVIKSIDQAIQDGCTILIVSASPSFAISRCLSDLPVSVLGTEFAMYDNIYTGLLKSENCYGQEKVNRINEWAQSNKIALNVQYAWSDHISDFDMLSLSKERYWVGGDRLRKLVKEKDSTANFVQ